jgi:hypothetical protein
LIMVETETWKNVKIASMLMSTYLIGSIRMVTRGVVFIIGVLVLRIVVMILNWLED